MCSNMCLVLVSFTKSLVPLAHNNTSMSSKAASLEITEFQSSCERDCHPYTTFCNHLFVYPLSLQFDSQKLFSRARNITVVVELRDSDKENAKPLKVSKRDPHSACSTSHVFVYFCVCVF